MPKAYGTILQPLVDYSQSTPLYCSRLSDCYVSMYKLSIGCQPSISTYVLDEKWVENNFKPSI